MKIEIGLNDAQRKPVVDILNRLLADEVTLYVKTRNFHWNICGPHFYSYHKLFESQYSEIEGIIDDIAEKIRSFGHIAPGSMKEFLKSSKLEECPGEDIDAKKMMTYLLDDHEQIARTLRVTVTDLKEPGTVNFLTGVMEKHEKMAWMLRVTAE